MDPVRDANELAGDFITEIPEDYETVKALLSVVSVDELNLWRYDSELPSAHGRHPIALCIVGKSLESSESSDPLETACYFKTLQALFDYGVEFDIYEPCCEHCGIVSTMDFVRDAKVAEWLLARGVRPSVSKDQPGDVQYLNRCRISNRVPVKGIR